VSVFVLQVRRGHPNLIGHGQQLSLVNERLAKELEAVAPRQATPSQGV